MNKVGALALIADPYIYVLDNSNLGLMCDDCFRVLDLDTKVKCFKCKYTYYCDDKCKSHSYDEIHDVECEFLKHYSIDKPVDVKVRMWARLLIRNHKGISNVTHYFEEDKCVTFDTLFFPYCAMKETRHYEKDYKDDCLRLAQYFIHKPEMMSSYTQEYLETMYLRMRYATLKIRTDPFEVPALGYGIYLVGTLIRCKCRANSVFKFDRLRLSAVIVEEIPNLRSITQVTVGKQPVFGFVNTDNLVREYLDCSCETCKGQQLELVSCQNSRCNQPFLIQKKVCPNCDAKLKPKFLKKYMKLRHSLFDILANAKVHDKPETLEAAKKVYADFQKVTHFCNTMRLRVMAYIIKVIPNKVRVAQLEFFSMFYNNLHGNYDLSRVTCLIRLTRYYCQLCDRKKLIFIHQVLKKVLPKLVSLDHPYLIQNEYMMNDIMDTKNQTKICRCTCNDVEEYIFY